MKKRVLALILAAVTADSLTACSGSPGIDIKAAPVQTKAPASESKPEAEKESKVGEGGAARIASSKGGAEGYEFALITDLGTIDDKSFSQGAWEGLKKYAGESNISYRYYQPQEGIIDSYSEAISLATEGGVKLVVCPGFLSREPIYMTQGKYPDVYFILPDGEPHDTGYNYKTSGNVMFILFQEDQAGFLAGYAVVEDGYAKLGFMEDMAALAATRFGYSFVQGAEFAAEGDAVTGLEIMYNHTGAFPATPEAQPMAASQYQNGMEVIFGCGGAVGNSVVAITQGKNARVVGVDVDQSAESEAVITSAMKFPSNPVYDGVKDFCNGSFPGGRISVFIVANNGVGIPMDTSKFEKSSQEQYGATYKRVADGKITLVQFPADNDDLTEGLIDLTNIKVTFVEQGLAGNMGCMRA